MTNPIDKNRRRPKMKDYGIANDEKGLISWDWVDEQMTKSRNYWIVSTRPDGNPHAAPVWGIWYEGTLYFGSGETSRKSRNIAHNPRIVVHLESGDDTVILEGFVKEEHDPAKIAPIDKLYAAKYPYDPTPSEMYMTFRPDLALAWLETDFMHSATRWDLEG